MTKYLIHKGTAIILDASDDVYILDTDHLNDDEQRLVVHGDEDDFLSITVERGRLLHDDDLELTRNNSIAFTENAIKEEMSSPQFEHLDEKIKDFVLNFATHEDFEIIAAEILNDERTWENYQPVITDALRLLVGRRTAERII